MNTRICKFGGTSLADASQIAKVRAIVDAEPGRRYVVPSAPGKRHADDQKITDLLYLCHEHARQGVPFNEVFSIVAERFTTIARELKVSLDLDAEFDTIRQTLADLARDGASADYAASRGEYLNGRIIAELLGWPFVDPTELIFFDRRGRLDESKTYSTLARRLGDLEHAVVPGFYGLGHDGQVKTFSRGGSDVTGAILARGVNANLYENWTDVTGLLMADPRVVDRPRTIDTITYRELRELAYMGATVLHDEAIFPVRNAGIPVNIRNTNAPNDPGTMIVSEAQPVAHAGAITGLAGRRDFTVIALEKALMNAELGFGRRVLSVLERNNVNFEHLPSGIDTMSLVISDDQLDGKLDDVIEALKNETEPDAIEVYPEMALLATVGRGMAHTPGMAARLFTALAEANVNIRMIDQGSSELNIIVGVAVEDFEPAMRAVYHAFVEAPDAAIQSS
ncbi:aspartate kinase [Phycisphaerales bacterium AB-hyl4]|uniref:Aspartokinase n=1 Tax=Natronomicrosphaera hydrolytica TaxID=3242702 RepID=A0ABV4U653_9BACT